MDNIMSANEINTSQKPDQFIFRRLVKGGTIKPQCPNIMNLMILNANLSIYDSISQRIFRNTFSVLSKPVPE